jgi:hypothetical protein
MPVDTPTSERRSKPFDDSRRTDHAMSKKLPYRLETETGAVIDLEFPLHRETASPVHTLQMLNAVLAAIDREVRETGPLSNGDVLQALAMALAARATMIHGSGADVAPIVKNLVDTALTAAADGARDHHTAGHA